MKDYREFKFWERTHRFVVRVHEVTRAFPKEELVNLTANLRRTATELGSALVEASHSVGERESIPQIQSALTTTSRLEYQLLLARDLGYLDETTFEELTVEIQDLRRQYNTHLTRVRTLR